MRKDRRDGSHDLGVFSCPPKSCRCRCGYKCGGPGVCKLPVMECIQQKSGHWEKDCDHDFSGEPVDMDGGFSVTCAKCGMEAMSHDMRVGP